MNVEDVSIRTFQQAARNAAAKRPRTLKEILIIREFLQKSRDWSVWEKLTKNIEYPANSTLQMKGEIEVLYEKEDGQTQTPSSKPPAASATSKSSTTENSKKEQSSTLNQSNLSAKDQKRISTSSLSSNLHPKFKSPNSPRRPLTIHSQSSASPNHRFKHDNQPLPTSTIQQLLISSKGRYYSHFSASDLEFTKPMQSNTTYLKADKSTFFSEYARVRINNDIDNSDSNLKINSSLKKSKGYYHPLSRKRCRSLSKSYIHITKDRYQQQDHFFYSSVTPVSYLTLDPDQIHEFYSKRAKHLTPYEQFLLDTLQQNSFFALPDFDYIQNIYTVRENLKARHVLIAKETMTLTQINSATTIAPSTLKQIVSIYLIKEGMFELSTSSSYSFPSNSYSIVNSSKKSRSHANRCIPLSTQQQQLQSGSTATPQQSNHTLAILQKGQFFGEEILFSTQNKAYFTISQKSPFSELIEIKVHLSQFHATMPINFLALLQTSYSEKMKLAFGNDQEYSEQATNYASPINPRYYPYPATSTAERTLCEYQLQRVNKGKSSLKRIVLNDQFNFNLSASATPESYELSQQYQPQQYQSKSIIGFSRPTSANSRTTTSPISYKNSTCGSTQVSRPTSALIPRTTNPPTLQEPEIIPTATVTTIPRFFRKNQFVKRNDNSSVTNSRTASMSPQDKRSQDKYFQEKNQFSIAAQTYQQSLPQTQPALASDNGVRTIRIVFDQQFDAKTIPSPKSQQDQFDLQPEFDTIGQGCQFPTQIEQGNRFGEVVMGRSLLRFNEIVRSRSPKSQEAMQATHKPLNGTTSSSSLFQFNAATGGAYVKRSSSDTDRMLTNSLKGTKIKRMSSKQKERIYVQREQSDLILLSTLAQQTNQHKVRRILLQEDNYQFVNSPKNQKKFHSLLSENGNNSKNPICEVKLPYQITSKRTLNPTLANGKTSRHSAPSPRKKRSKEQAHS